MRTLLYVRVRPKTPNSLNIVDSRTPNSRPHEARLAHGSLGPEHRPGANPRGGLAREAGLSPRPIAAGTHAADGSEGGHSVHVGEGPRQPPGMGCGVPRVLVSRGAADMESVGHEHRLQRTAASGPLSLFFNTFLLIPGRKGDGEGEGGISDESASLMGCFPHPPLEVVPLTGNQTVASCFIGRQPLSHPAGLCFTSTRLRVSRTCAWAVGPSRALSCS